MTTTYSQRFELFMEQFPRLALVPDRDRNSIERIGSMMTAYGRNPMQLNFETIAYQEKCFNFLCQEFEQVRQQRLHLLDGAADSWDFDDMMAGLRTCDATIITTIDDLMKRMTDEQTSSFVQGVEDMVLADKQVIVFGASKAFAFQFCELSYYAQVGNLTYLNHLRQRRKGLQ